MKTYKVLRLTVFFIYGLLGMVSLIGIFLIFQSFKGGQGMVPDQLMLLIWLAVLAWVWYFYGRLPTAITWRDEGVLEFKSLLGTTRVPVQEVVALKATPMTWGFIKLYHRSGSLRLFNQVTGLYELIGTIKAHNPTVEIVGC